MMVSNKKARLTLQQPSAWDEYRPINKRINNNVLVTVWPAPMPGTISYSEVLRK